MTIRMGIEANGSGMLTNPAGCDRVMGMEPRILREEEDWVAVSKPAGMLCHPTKPGGPITLRDWFLRNYPGELGACANRLDRETSGIVLVARTREGASRLGKLLMARALAKEYLALVHGVPPERMRMDFPLARLGDYGPSEIYLKQGVVPGGAEALTETERVVAGHHPQFGPLAVVRCRPLTGRLHQIRVHLAHAGYPLVGDKLYGRAPEAYLEFIRTGWSEALEKRLFFPRHALHASRVSWEEKGTVVTIQDPLPEDMAGVLRQMEPGGCGSDCAAPVTAGRK